MLLTEMNHSVTFTHVLPRKLDAAHLSLRDAAPGLSDSGRPLGSPPVSRGALHRCCGCWAAGEALSGAGEAGGGRSAEICTLMNRVVC